MVRAAAGGDAESRAVFVTRYAPVVRSCLVARWRGTRLVDAVDDAVQEVFLECLRMDGVLEKAEPGRAGGFGAFLLGVVRNIAAREERSFARQQMRAAVLDPEVLVNDETEVSRSFDRAWARLLVREAAERMHTNAKKKGEAALRRVQLLRLRFQEDLPIRDIAPQFGMEAAALHNDYATARKEYKQALREVVLFHRPDVGRELESECKKLLGLFR